MNSTLISVIIPAYNSESTLERCLDSVLFALGELDDSPGEMILVDDGSTDRTPEILDHYGQDKSSANIFIRVIHQMNSGVSAARNAGIDAATGKYICFIDSDDYIEPEYFNCLLSAGKHFPEAGHIWCGFQTVSENNREKAESYLYSDEEISALDRADYMKLYTAWLTQGPVCKLYKASVIKNNSLFFDVSINYGEDIIFNLDYLDAEDRTKIVFLNKPLYYYLRDASDSLVHMFRPDLLELYRNIEKSIEGYLVKWGATEENWQLYYNAVFWNYDYIMRNTFRAENPMSKKEKIEYNNRILNSKDFKKVLEKRKCYVHPLIIASLKSGYYQNVIIIQKLIELKRALFKSKSVVLHRSL